MSSWVGSAYIRRSSGPSAGKRSPRQLTAALESCGDAEEDQAKSEGRGQLQLARTGLGAGAHVRRTRADNRSPAGATREGKVHGPVHARRARRATGLRGGGSQPLDGQAASQGTRRALHASPPSNGVVR